MTPHFRATLLLVAGIAALGSTTASAHHAFSANFDVDGMIEVRGRVTELQWQNPHVLISLETAAGETWVVESQAKNILERTAIVADHFAVGSTVAFAGYPAREGPGIFALNALLADGRELILRAGQPARFGGRPGSSPENVLAAGVSADAAAREAGIFRVWSMQFAGEGRWRWPDSYPLTSAAEDAAARFDPARDLPADDCAQKPMPWIMEQPFPLEIARQGDDIVLRIEEGDVIRTIHMQDSPPSPIQPSPWGYSVGRWDGGDLVVRTSAIAARYLNARGIPLTAAVSTDERFSLAPDGSRLDYTLTITDPGTFTEPVTVESYRVWRPEITIEPYDCSRERPRR